MYLIFDTETTSFPYWNAPADYHLQARICQIACILLDEEFKEVAAFHSLVKPDGWTISDGARNKHGISDEICAKYGAPIKVCLGVITSFMERAEHVICHNIKFDKFMLEIELQLAGFPLYNWSSQGICTMLQSTDVLKLPKSSNRGAGLYKWPKLEELYKYCTGKEHTFAHEAMGDVQATAKCFAWLVEHGHVVIPSRLVEVKIGGDVE